MRSTTSRSAAAGIGVLLCLCTVPVGAVGDEGVLSLSLEDLLNVEVTSVSKRAQPVADAAAAVFVLTAEDIARSGATSLPEALRLVPGLHVARIDASKWAVGSRGFNSRTSNKLLVLIDGRSVYTPSFSGVYWEVQDVLLEDVDRIEVIRGPGSALWGANAVNGVINVITKHAADTQGGYVSTTLGTEELGLAAMRYGTSLGEGCYLRVYGKASDRDAFVDDRGEAAIDAWHLMSGGVRLDADLSPHDAFMLQGGAYDGEFEQVAMLPLLTPPYVQFERDEATASGRNVLARWQRTLSPTSTLSVQAYADHYERLDVFQQEKTDVLDLEIQHAFTLGAHDLVWGTGVRRLRDRLWVYEGYPAGQLLELRLYSLFAQDQVPLFGPSWELTLGGKVEHHTYTGYEIQPSARLLWKLHEGHHVWAAVSRAVRTPSRIERGMNVLRLVVPPGAFGNPGPVPAAVYIQGTSDFESEDLLAWEMGYRHTHDTVSLDVAVFLNDYENLRSFPPAVVTPTPTRIEIVQQFVSDSSDRTYGGELSAVWAPSAAWRWTLAYTYFRREYAGVSSEALPGQEVMPEHIASLRVSMRPHRDFDLDGWLRYVDDCKSMSSSGLGAEWTDAYLTLDLRLALRPSADVELSLVGQNLFQDHHPEFTTETMTLRTETQRGVYARLDWNF